MAIDERIEAELKKIVKPEQLQQAKKAMEDLRQYSIDANLITLLLADNVIDEKQAFRILSRAQANKDLSTSVIQATNTVKKALSALGGANETMLKASKSEEDLELPETYYDDPTIPPKTTTVPSPSAKPAPASRKKGGRYKDVKLLGQGGMGAVYKAYDTNMSREVALKTLRPDLEGETKILCLQRFHNEIQATAQLADCENIVVAYNVETDNKKNVFLTLEYVKGEPLDEIINKIQFDQNDHIKQLIKRKKILEENIEKYKQHTKAVKQYQSEIKKIDEELKPEKIKELQKENEEYKEKYNIKELMRLFWESSTALAFTHDHGYVHRDVKPGNIMIKKDKTKTKAKLMDFGLAKKIDEEASQYLEGTPSYMSPQQFSGEKHSIQDDIWAMGVMLYKILTGRQPFEAETQQALAVKIINDEPPLHPGKIRRGLEEKPPELCEIAMKALQKNAKERYETMDALADDVKAWLEYRPVSVYKDSTKEALKKTLKRKPWIKYVAGVGATVTLAALAIGGPILYISESKASHRAEQAKISQEKADQAKQSEERERIQKEKAQEEERKAKEEKERAEREQAEKEAKRRLAMDEYQKGIDFVRKYNDLETAVKHFNKAIEIYPNLGDAYYEKGIIEYSNLFHEEAIKEFINANNASQNDTQQIHKPAAFYTGLVYLDLCDDVPKSTEYFKKVIEKTEEDDYFTLLARSLVSYIEKDYDKAINLAELATQKYKNCWEGWFVSAAYRMQGASNNFTDPGLTPYKDLENALKSLNNAISLSPGQLRCRTMRAQLYCAMGEPEKGNQDVKQLLQQHPDMPSLLLVLAITEYSMKQNQKSLETLINAERQGADTAINNFYQALNYMSMQEYEKAEEQFTKSIEKKPGSKKYTYRGYARFEQGKIEEAIEDEKQALTMEKEPQAHLILGLCYKEKKNYELAIQNLQEACNLQLAPAYRELGMLYAEQNNKKAIPYLKAYLNTNDSYEREKVIQTIKELEKQ